MKEDSMSSRPEEAGGGAQRWALRRNREVRWRVEAAECASPRSDPVRCCHWMGLPRTRQPGLCHVTCPRFPRNWFFIPRMMLNN